MEQLKTGSPVSPGGWVALVDDDAHIAQALKLLLSFKDVHTSVHPSAESLLAALQMRQGQWLLQTPQGQHRSLAAAVVDLNLPGINGADLVMHLRSLSPQIRLVMITAAHNELLQKRGDELRGVVCLAKPFSLDALEAALFES